MCIIYLLFLCLTLTLVCLFPFQQQNGIENHVEVIEIDEPCDGTFKILAHIAIAAGADVHCKLNSLFVCFSFLQFFFVVCFVCVRYFPYSFLIILYRFFLFFFLDYFLFKSFFFFFFFFFVLLIICQQIFCMRDWRDCGTRWSWPSAITAPAFQSSRKSTSKA